MGGGAERSRREPRGRALLLCSTGGVRSCFSEPRFPYLRNGDVSTPVLVGDARMSRERGARKGCRRSPADARPPLWALPLSTACPSTSRSQSGQVLRPEVSPWLVSAQEFGHRFPFPAVLVVRVALTEHRRLGG